jgi:asparagine synthase (glutamine-hydrolysing)
MFAFSVWDRRTRTLYLVRDRLGIKPLYWARFGGLFLFGSELKSLRAHPGIDWRVNRSAIASFMRYSYIPAPHTIYENVYKLHPGTIMSIDGRAAMRTERFWTLEAAITRAAAGHADLSDAEAVTAAEDLMADAVSKRMIADVPLGAFLSGGIDSSTVVALMQKHSTKRVRTFSIGFHEPGYNEAVHAGRVARHLGTEHTEFYVSPKDAQDVIPLLADMFDEPFADSSQIPTYLVSRLTRRHVTVALSGDGGDEVFAGYNRYTLADRLVRGMKLLTGPGRRLLRSIIHVLPPRLWGRVFECMPGRLHVPQAGDKLYKLADILMEERRAIYTRLVSHWDRPGELVPEGGSAESLLTEDEFAATLDSFIEQMQYLDTITYLPDDILTKVDRASMAVSLEARVPLLDHRLVEFAWSLPVSMKVREGQGKWLLRQILHKYVPRELVERPKMGFGVPIDEWLRGPLREWAESLLDERRMREQGLLDPEPVRRKFAEHLSGKRNWQYHLWDVLMFQAWHARWM